MAPSSDTPSPAPRQLVNPGDRFHDWVALRETSRVDYHSCPYWLCRCICGREREVRRCALRGGYSKSCGCSRKIPKPILSRRFQRSKLVPARPLKKERNAWWNMNRRCSHPENPSYRNYGAKGITVCDRFRSSFEAFIEDMGPAPSLDHSLDRINPHLGYFCGKCPECREAGRVANCRWTTWDVQVNNKVNSRKIEFEGQSLTVTEWARVLGLSPMTLLGRLHKGEKPPHAFRPVSKKGRRPNLQMPLIAEYPSGLFSELCWR